MSTPKTEAQKRAQKTYMDKFCVLRVRVAPEMGAEIKAHAEISGESTNAFITRAITETIERDRAEEASADRQDNTQTDNS